MNCSRFVAFTFNNVLKNLLSNRGKLIISVICSVAILFLSSLSLAGRGIVYHGRILKSDGTPLEASGVNLRIQIKSPGSEDCLLYEESKTVDMTSSNGVFVFTLNTGTGRTDSTGFSLPQIFSNRTSFSFTHGECASGSTYTPGSTDSRKFSDVTGTQGATVVANVGGSTAALIHNAELIANSATANNTASTVVRRDSANATTLSTLVLNDSQGTPNSVSLQAPAAVTTNYVLRFPATAGTANQVLITDGSGVLSWSTPAVTSGISVTSPITNSGTASTPTIAIQQANGTQPGYLSNTDWTTFNNKQATTLAPASIWVGNGSSVATAVILHQVMSP